MTKLPTRAARMTVLLLLAVGACGRARITSAGGSVGALPPPDGVLIYDLAVSPEQVSRDRGLGPRLADGFDTTPRTEKERQLGERLAQAFSDALVEQLRHAGLDARRAAASEPAPPGPLLITGEFLSIDEGNRTARVVVGLGMGRSKVQALVHVYESLPDSPVLVREYLGDADSGFKPGMAESLGVGAVATTIAGAAATSSALAVGSESFIASIDADAKRMADRLAKQILALYASRHWATRQ